MPKLIEETIRIGDHVAPIYRYDMRDILRRRFMREYEKLICDNAGIPKRILVPDERADNTRGEQ